MTRTASLIAVLVAAAAVALMAGCSPQSGPQAGPAATVAVPAAAGTQAPGPSATPEPARPSAQVGSALEWYPMAAEIAQGWQPDAVLHSVVGGNVASDGSSLPCDGRAELWNYTFVSVGARKNLQVFVRGGKVDSQLEDDLKAMGQPVDDESIQYYTDLCPSGDWKVDSTQATEVANREFRARYNQEPGIVSYVMFNAKYMDLINNKTIPWMYWNIAYDPERTPFSLTLDARTGEVKERP
ncbi:MAG: hypothetical protein QME94_05050 [Anaerolineae bacterium]|nr:hypothetical protein [Anaerolineae bacterium]